MGHSDPGGGAGGFVGLDTEMYAALEDAKKYSFSDDNSEDSVDYSVNQGTYVPEYATMEANYNKLPSAKEVDTRATMNSAQYVNLQSGINNKTIHVSPTITKITPTSTESNSGGEDKKRPPKEYLSVGAHASRYYRKEFAKLRDPDLLNKQTRSYIERRVASEINTLQRKRYSYRSTKEEEKKRAQMRSDIRNSGRGFYANLTKTLSNYAVLVGDLNKMPNFNSSNINRRGVYAK